MWCWNPHRFSKGSNRLHGFILRYAQWKKKKKKKENQNREGGEAHLHVFLFPIWFGAGIKEIGMWLHYHGRQTVAKVQMESLCLVRLVRARGNRKARSASAADRVATEMTSLWHKPLHSHAGFMTGPRASRLKGQKDRKVCVCVCVCVLREGGVGELIGLFEDWRGTFWGRSRS